MSVVTSTRSPLPLADADLVQQIVHLAAHRPHFDLRIDETRRTNDLLDDRAFRQPQLDLARRRGDVERARRQRQELVEHQRPVVERARQAEPVVDQRELARAVAVEHSADLRQRHVRLVHDDEKILREIIEQARRPLALRAPGQVARVVLDSRAGADLEHHLDVEVRARLEPLRFEQLARRAKLGQPLRQLLADRARPRARSSAAT